MKYVSTLAGAVTLLITTASLGQAATRDWVGASADWNTASNWNAASIPGSADTANFASNSALFTTVTLSSPSPLGSLTFTGSPSSYTIGTAGGNALTLSSSGSITSTAGGTSAQFINAPLTLSNTANTTYLLGNNAASSSATLSFGGAITGSSATGTTLTLGGSNAGLNSIDGSINDGASPLGLVKSGTGTWVITGTNNATGATTLRSGALILDYTSSATSKLTSGALTLGGIDLRLQGGSGTQTVASTAISGGGKANVSRVSGSETIALGAITAPFTTGSGAVSSVNFQSGVATTTTTTAVNTGAAGLLGGWATVDGTDWAMSGPTGTNTIVAYNNYTTLTAASTITALNYQLVDSLTTNASFSNANTLKIGTTGATAGALTLTARTTTGPNGGILYTGAGDYTINGAVLGLGASGTSIHQNGTGVLQIDSQVLGQLSGGAIYFQKDGAGTLVLTGANAWKPAFTIQEGVVSVSSDANLGGASGSIVVTSSSTSSTSVTLQSAAPSTLISGASFLGSTVTAVSGTSVTLAANANQAISSATSAPYAIGAGLVVNGGTLRATGTFALQETGATTINRTIALGGNGGTFEVTGGNTLTAPGVVSNLTGTAPTLSAGALTKIGAGTMVLSGVNTYTGGTTITAGALLAANATGSATGTGAVALGAATLGGSGFITGLVTSAGTASNIAPIGTLTLSGGFNAIAGSSFSFDLGTSSDLLSLGSGVFTGSTAAGGLLFNFADAGGFLAGNPYTLATFGSSLGLDYTDLSATAFPSGYSLDSSFGTGGFLINGTSLQVQFAAVPEPGTWALFSLGAVLMAGGIRQRRARL